MIELNLANNSGETWPKPEVAAKLRRTARSECNERDQHSH